MDEVAFFVGKPEIDGASFVLSHLNEQNGCDGHDRLQECDDRNSEEDCEDTDLKTVRFLVLLGRNVVDNHG